MESVQWRAASFVFRGARRSYLGDLRGRRRVVADVRRSAFFDGAVAQAFVFRRRLLVGDCVVIPVCTESSAADGFEAAAGETESRWVYTAAEPEAWLHAQP